MNQADYMLWEYGEMVEHALKSLIKPALPYADDVRKAMEYSLLSGGKRIRPALLLEFYRVCGGEPGDAMAFACAIEMIHTYSLIHDDLPCMDDDNMRRGRPACHIVFGENIALLAGDALLTMAFETALGSDDNGPITSKNCKKAAGLLAQAAGIHGMVGGQVVDLQSEGQDIGIDLLQVMHKMKTGALIKAAACIGCVLADAPEEQIAAAETYAAHIGLAFQIVDDILDTVGDSTSLGKPVGSDKQKNKNTYISLLGIKKSREAVDDLTKTAVQKLDVFPVEKIVTLSQLADLLKNRKV